MAHAAWKGTLSFGLVEIPVALRPADEPDELHFTLLDKRDLSPIGYRKINKSTGEEVPSDEIVKGFEHESERYVLLDDEDFKRANLKASGTIEIDGFVDVDEIDPVYFERPYFVEPLKRPSKGYVLLREALLRKGKAGVATLVLRNRAHLAALVPRKDVLVLILLRYANELRDPSGIVVPKGTKGVDVKEKEVEMAEKLVDGMSAKWAPERYHDAYRDDLMALIEKRVKSGKATEIPHGAKVEVKPRETSSSAILRLLEQSVAKTGRGGGGKPTKSARAEHGRKTA